MIRHRRRRRQLVLEMVVIVFDHRRTAHRAATGAAWNFDVVSKVKITVDDGCDGGRNTVAVAIAITTTAYAAAAVVATIALRNIDAVVVAVGGRSGRDASHR